MTRDFEKFVAFCWCSVKIVGLLAKRSETTHTQEWDTPKILAIERSPIQANFLEKDFWGTELRLCWARLLNKF